MNPLPSLNLPHVRRQVIFTLILLSLFVIFLIAVEISSLFILTRHISTMLHERSQKLELSFRAVELSHQLNTRQSAVEPALKTELNDVVQELSLLVRTPQGRELTARLQGALIHLDAGGDPAEVLLAAQAMDNFQRRRLGEDVQAMEKEMHHYTQLVALTSTALVFLFTLPLFITLTQRSREYFLARLILRTTRNGVLVGDRRGRIVAVNPVFEQLIGCRSGTCRTGHPLSEAGAAGTILAQAIQKQNFGPPVELLLEKGNNTRCLLVETIPWYDHRAHLLGGMALIKDITAQWQEKKRLEEENTQLKEKAERDPLTGLYNYGSLLRHLHQALKEAATQRQPLAFVMLDLDNFKIYNDTLGHLSGDQLLVEFAGILRKSVRRNDVVARYGGDEFALILPATDLSTAREISERIRVTVANHPFPQRECLPGGRVTVSIGIAVYPTNGFTVEELIRCADKALYEAKRMARNRVEVYWSAQEELKNILQEQGNGILTTTIKSFLLLLQSRDRYTYHHAEKVVKYCSLLGERLGLNEKELQLLRTAALVHDIGKVHLDPAILSKEGPLTPEEWLEMKKHPLYGADIMEPFFGRQSPVIQAVRHHHERWDGSGYPAGLRGEEIPFYARIIAVADAFDAITSDRPYRSARSPEQAVAELEREVNRQFDPRVVHAMLAIAHTLPHTPPALRAV